MDKKNYRFCVGGLMLLIATIWDILLPLINVLINSIIYSGMGSHLNTMLTTAITGVIGNVITYAPFLILTIFLLLKKRGTPIMVMSIITLVIEVLGAALGLLGTLAASSVSDASYTINFASYVVILVHALFLALSVSTRKPQTGSFGKLWFLPGIAYCVHIVAYIVYLFVYWSNLINDVFMKNLLLTVGGVLLAHIPGMVLHCIGYFLAGKWLANPYKKGFTPAPPQYPQYNPYMNYPQGQ